MTTLRPYYGNKAKINATVALRIASIGQKSIKLKDEDLLHFGKTIFPASVNRPT